jgi:hypothetical protein
VPPSNKSLAILAITLAAGFFYGLWKLYELRFAAGDIYPPYSSLRADPMGTKALYESIPQLPGASADRNYLPIEKAPKGDATLLFLGEEPYIFEALPEKRLKEFEALALSGSRVVIAMRPLLRLPAQKPEQKAAPEIEIHDPLPILKRWRVSFGYITRPADEDDESVTGTPKQTALYFRYEGKTMPRLELPFGNGVIVLLANSYPLSNEALADDRDVEFLAWTIGGNRQVIFDEHHLGITESGGIVTLARKYRLEGMAAALLLLLGLFIWKNSTSFLPPSEPASSFRTATVRERLQFEPASSFQSAAVRERSQSEPDDSVEAKDISAGLANLLRRNVSRKQLLQLCLKQWENSQYGGRYYSPVKLERVRNLARQDGDAAETYRRMSKILTERSDR